MKTLGFSSDLPCGKYQKDDETLYVPYVTANKLVLRAVL